MNFLGLSELQFWLNSFLFHNFKIVNHLIISFFEELISSDMLYRYSYFIVNSIHNFFSDIDWLG